MGLPAPLDVVGVGTLTHNPPGPYAVLSPPPAGAWSPSPGNAARGLLGGGLEAIAPLVSHVALLFSVLALIGSTLAWHFSRAGRVRAFELQMGDAVAQLLARIENQDLRLSGMQTAQVAQTDDMNRVLASIVKERKRVKQANAMADQRETDEADAEPRAPPTREEQKRAIKLRLAGTA